MSKLLDNAISVGLMLIVAFAALAHGVVEPWSIFVFELATAVLALLWTVKAVADKNLTLVIPQTIWPLAALTLLGLAQSVSWNDGAGVRQSLSLDVENTRGTVLVLCSLLALSVLAANFLTSSRWLLTLTRFLIFFGAVMGVFGLVQYFSGSSSIYWLRHAGGSAFGPFFNRDHFAGYMELLIALPVALIVTSYLCGEKRLVYGIAAMFMGVAAIVIGVIWIGAEPVINRIATGDPNSSDLGKTQSFYSVRGEIWENTWTMIRHNPLTGVGLGAYETAYPIYSRENGTQGITGEAHNDYLQILADAGVVGAVLALWFICELFRAVARGVRSPDPLMAAIALGGGAGLFGLLVHSIFDFNLHLPSHAMVFLLLSMVISHVGATVDEPVKAESASMSVAPRLMREAS